MTTVSTIEHEDLLRSLPDVLPVLPLKNTILFPYNIVPLSISSKRSILAVDHALVENRLILLTGQLDPLQDEPEEDDLYHCGTTALIMRMLKLPDGRIRILVQGLARAKLEYLSQSEPFLQARISTVDEPEIEEAIESVALLRTVKDLLDDVVSLGKGVSSEVMVIASNLDDPGRLADLTASNLDLKMADAQAILETVDRVARLRIVSEQLIHEVQLLNMQHKLSSQTREEIDRSQREFFLRQQLRTIQEELGEADSLTEELNAYRRQIEDSDLTDEAAGEIEKQIKRLQNAHPDSAENSMIRTYLDCVTALPWGRQSEDNLDLSHARAVLDEDHFDLENVKERILEYLAVRKLKADAKGPILCFIGPPGVGKTSLGRSIARTLGREFVRISLGGVHDEAEIRGHRRTYVGALPGRILQGIQQASTDNPVFMLDEIDKIGTDFRGDPSSALLEVLDPEQNSGFRDHYLGLDYDLSNVLFITTGNLVEPIQPAFLDRMEVLRLSGYTQQEKVKIADRHLVPKQLEANGLTEQNLRFTNGGLESVISAYTREAGVRNLEREIASLCRKVAVRVAEGRDKPLVLDARRVRKLLGVPRHWAEELLDRDRVGVATGLAWTAAGGDLMFIEALTTQGRGELLLTGQLGDVMKESAQAALSFSRAYAERVGEPQTLKERDVHIHVPAGSVPKDGPSAGVTIATAIVSLLLDRPVRRKTALTGEITLRGEVLPIGGVKEKVLAARSAGVDGVILPRLNERDVAVIPAALRKGLEFHYVDTMEELLELALVDSDE